MRLAICWSVSLLALFGSVSAQTISKPSKDLLSVDRDWADWAAHGGEGAAERLNVILSDDYTFTGTGWDALSKSEYLSRVVRHTTYRTEGVEVRQYGDTALVTGRIHLDNSEGVTIRKQYPVNYDHVRYINVYVAQSGKWRLVSTQFSPILESSH
jgi:hypothetical protein